MNNAQKVILILGAILFILALAVFPATKEVVIPESAHGNFFKFYDYQKQIDYVWTIFRAFAIFIGTGVLFMILKSKNQNERDI